MKLAMPPGGRPVYKRRMRIAVTGASGHVGANLLPVLRQAGHDVRALVRHDRRALDGLDVQAVTGSIEDSEALARLFDGVDASIHLAAVISIDGDRDGSVVRTNVEGAGRVAAAALQARVHRHVHISSIHAFDLRGEGPMDEGSPRVGPSGGAYDRSKAAGEVAVRAVFEQGLDGVIVNPTGVIGPRDWKPSRMGILLGDLWRGRLPAIVPGGFDWIDARDLATTILAALERGERGQNYLCGGSWHTIEELCRIGAALAGVRAPWVLPRAPIYAISPLIAAISRALGQEPIFTSEALDAVAVRVRPSSARAASVLGHRPRPIEETLADTLSWHRAHPR